MAACIPCASAAVANPIVAPFAIAGYAAYRLSKEKNVLKERNKKTRRKICKKRLSSKK